MLRRFVARARRMPIRRQLKPSLVVVVLVLGAFLVLTLFGDVLAPHSPYKVALPQRLQPPAWQEGGSWSHPLGTDTVGRDSLSRLMLGARVSLIVAVAALVVGAGIGTFLGLVAALYGGKVDAVIMRAADITIAMPLILFALLFAVTLGPSLRTVIVAIFLVIWARYARVIRGEATRIKQETFIAQAVVVGSSRMRIIFRHLLPNVLPTLFVLVSLQIGGVILTETSLSFLGAGVPPPTPSWGNMVAEGRNYLTSAWWLTFFPGIAIVLVVLSFNLLGDWLRDVLDPKLRQT